MGIKFSWTEPSVAQNSGTMGFLFLPVFTMVFPGPAKFSPAFGG